MQSMRVVSIVGLWKWGRYQSSDVVKKLGCKGWQ